MKKITYIIDDLRIGGAEIHLLRLANALQTRDYHIEIICLGDFEKAKAYGKCNSAIKIHTIKMDCIWRLYFWKNFLNLIQLLKKTNPTIVHTYLNTSNVFGFLAAKIACVPIIIGSRRDMGHFRSNVIGLLEKIISRFNDRIVCVSNAVKENVLKQEKVADDKITVIYNGVDPQLPETKNNQKINDCFNIGMVATMNRKIKGHRYFIDAATKVIKKRKDVRFILIGDGLLREPLEDLVKARGISRYFCFEGNCKDVRRELLNIDILVSPSGSEGFSNAILEAMAMQIPVIATAVEGNLEVIEDRLSGHLVDTANPNAIAEKILQILQNPADAVEIGHNARKRILKHFTIEHMVNGYKKLYDAFFQKKIAYILSQFPETHETFILREISELKNKGIDISIISLKPCRNKVIHPEARELMGRTIYARVYGLWSMVYGLIHPVRTVKTLLYVLKTYYKQPKELIKALYVYFEALSMVGLLKKKRITHIHSHWATMPTTAAMILSKLTDIPFSFTAHAWDIFLSDKRDICNKLNNAKFVITCTDYNRKYLIEQLGLDENKVYLNYHGLEREWFAGTNYKLQTTNYNPLRILAIGRLVEQKGFEYLIRACRILKDKGIHFECSIVGDGPLKKALSAMSYELRTNVELLGIKTQDEIKKLYNETDVFVAPSVIAMDGDRDGIPNVILEAMAMGIPVVGTNVSGLPEALIHEKTGLVIPERNPNALGEAIDRLITDLNLRNKLCETGKRHVSEYFDLDKNASDLMKIFEQNITESRRPKGVPSEIKGKPKAESRIKALYVIWSLEKGGAERFWVNLLKNIDKTKILPVVCCLNWKGAWAHELEEIGIEVIALNKRKGIDIKAFVTLVKLMRNNKFNLVNTCLWTSDVIGRLAALCAGIPTVISTAQNTDPWKKPWHKIIDKLLFFKTDKIITVSDAVKNFYQENLPISSAKLITIPNAIETDKFENVKSSFYLYDELGVTAHDFILACIGRLTKVKSQKYLLQSLSLLKVEYPNLRILLVGDGEDKEALIKEACDLGVSHMVRFLGHRKDIPEILAFCNVLVLSSITEGLPVCIIEAMAAGKAVIATRVGGVEEIVINNETGFIVPPKDVTALAQAIKKIINLPDKGKKMGEKGRSVAVNNFSIKSIAQKTSDLILSLAEVK